MKFQIRRLLQGLLSAFIMISAPVAAGIIKFDFEGAVTSSDSSEIGIGDGLTGEFIYDSDAVISSFPTGGGSAYDISSDGYEISIQIGAFTFSSSGVLDLFVLNDSPDDRLDPLAEAGGPGTSPSDFTPGELSLRLTGTTDFLLVTGDILPELVSQIDTTEILSGSGIISSGENEFEAINFNISADSVRVSSVPEPTTLALLSLGLAGLGFTRSGMKA